MSVGLILASSMLVQASGAPVATTPATQFAPANAPAAPVPPKVAEAAEPARKDCSPTAPDPKSDTIVVCVEKSDGYRINPDILAGKQAKRDAAHGRPLNRAERMADNTCAVGPHPCTDTGINLLALAAVTAEIAARLSKGEEIGSIFKTQPGSSDYQYYQLAKHEREQRQAAAGIVKPYVSKADAATAAHEAAVTAAEKAATGKPADEDK